MTLFGIESPGLTSSLAIGEEVAGALPREEQVQLTRMLRDLGRHAADDISVGNKSPST